MSVLSYSGLDALPQEKQKDQASIFFVLPCTDTFVKVDMRTISFDIPPQEILTKDSVTVCVDGVVYFRVSSAIASVANVSDSDQATRLLAQTTLRNVTLDEATDNWGIKVERVEIKDVKLPLQMQRSMAAEAEATREARAKIIKEYERAVIFRLGRITSGKAKGPGKLDAPQESGAENQVRVISVDWANLPLKVKLKKQLLVSGIFFVLPCTDTFVKVDIRTISFDIPPQEILTKDSVTVCVDGVVYFRVSSAIASVANVSDSDQATRLLAQTTLRNVLGTKNLSQILSDREEIAHNMQVKKYQR
ncbi:UNVERIFIED_CONTAM: hypothetical protein FKN15_072668 [Acipenser sinensis]